MKRTLPKSTPKEQALTVLPPEPATLSADFTHARHLMNAARGSMMQAAGFMVLTGLELKRLKKSHGETRGRKKITATVRIISWADICQSELGISEDTAGRYILMAEAAKERSKVLQSMEEQLLALPLIALPEADRERVEKAVHKITDGNTAKGLMQDWGIARKDSGITPANRHPGGNSTKSKTTPEEDAQEFFGIVWKLISGLRHDAPDAFERHLAHLPLDLSAVDDAANTVTLAHFSDELQAWADAVETMRKSLVRALHAGGGQGTKATRHQGTKA